MLQKGWLTEYHYQLKQTLVRREELGEWGREEIKNVTIGIEWWNKIIDL